MSTLQLYSMEATCLGLRRFLPKDDPLYLSPEQYKDLMFDLDVRTIEYVDSLLYSRGF